MKQHITYYYAEGRMNGCKCTLVNVLKYIACNYSGRDLQKTNRKGLPKIEQYCQVEILLMT